MRKTKRRLGHEKSGAGCTSSTWLAPALKKLSFFMSGRLSLMGSFFHAHCTCTQVLRLKYAVPPLMCVKALQLCVPP